MDITKGTEAYLLDVVWGWADKIVNEGRDTTDVSWVPIKKVEFMGVRPNIDYMTVQTTSYYDPPFVNVGKIQQKEGEDVYYYVARWEESHVVTFQTFGKRAGELISLVRYGIKTGAESNELSSAGVSLLYADGISNLSQILDNDSESRRSMDITFLLGAQIQVPVEIIETIEIEGRIGTKKLKWMLKEA